MRRLIWCVLALLLPLRVGAQSASPGVNYYPAQGIAATQVQTVYNVKAYGATGNGITDDTAAIQAALTAVPATGGVVYLPGGTYKVTATLTVKDGTIVRGDRGGKEGLSGSAWLGATLDGSSITTGPFYVLYMPQAVGSRNFVTIEGISIKLAAAASLSSVNPGSVAGAVFGVYLAATTGVTIRDVYIEGGNQGIVVANSNNVVVQDCFVLLSKNAGVAIWGLSTHVSVIRGLYTNNGRSDQADNGNIIIGFTGAATVPTDVQVIAPLVDEGAGSSVAVVRGQDIHLEINRVYLSGINSNGTGAGYGIRIGSSAAGDTPTRVTVTGTRVEPYVIDANRIATATILLYGSGHRLIGVSTNPNSANGGLDILDNAADTQYIDVNGSNTNYTSVVADATIPYGSVVMPDAGTDGRFDINTGSATLAIGVVQGNSDTAQGTAYPVASTGRAYVRMQEDVGATRGHWAIVSATAGLVNDSATVTTIGLNVGKFLRSEGVTATINNAGCTGGSGCVNTALNTPSAGPAGQITLGVDVAALGWAVGDAVQYWNSGGASITGLTDGQTYFLNTVSTTKVTLCAVKGSGTIIVPSSQGNDATQYLIRLPLVAVSLQ